MSERIIPTEEIVPKRCTFRVMSNGCGACIRTDIAEEDFCMLKCDDPKKAPEKCPLNKERAGEKPLTISKPKDCPFRNLVACLHPERPLSNEFLIMKCSDNGKFPRLCPLKKAGDEE